MRCQTHIGAIINVELPLQQGGLNNKYLVEFFPQINHKLKKPLLVEHYSFIDFFYVFTYNYDEKISRKEKEILRFSMRSGKIINLNDMMIDLDIAFQYIPFEPMTFRVKAISFSPIYVLDWFNTKH